MGWGSQQWIRCTKEATYGSFDGSAAAGDVNWFRLVGNSPFTMRAVPQRVIIRSADAGNRRRQVVSGRYAVAGTLSTTFNPSQAAKVLEAALTLTSNDLPSYTLDFWDTIQALRFTGCKVSSMDIVSNAQQDYCSLKLGFIGQAKTTTTLAQPADSVLPTDLPYEHIESSTLFTLSASAQTKYSSLAISLKNTLAPTWDETSTITNLYYAGRDLDLNIRRQYIATTLRLAFEAQTAQTVSVAWARSGGLTTTFNLKTKSYLASFTDETPLDGATYQSMDFQAFYDTGTSTDLSFTVA